MEFFNKSVGEYPYKQYSIIQGGDGGMEYAMCTLITGKRSLPSLIGVTAHEFAHMWFQHLLATNESKHGWMDEGFTSFISDFAVNQIMDKKNQEDQNPFQTMYNNYFLYGKKVANNRFLHMPTVLMITLITEFLHTPKELSLYRSWLM